MNSRRLLAPSLLLALGLTLQQVSFAQDLDSELDSMQETGAAAPTENQSSSGTDQPNLDFERRMYNIFHAAPLVDDAKWEEMIGSRREDLYVVQPGDTLWDISTTLFGDGFYWSKLWAENGRVENPHQISKGQGIRFLAGTEEAAPQVDVVSEQVVESIQVNLLRETGGKAPTYREQALKDISPEELAAGGDIEVDELIPAPTIPAGKLVKPVLKDLPGSFVSRKVPSDELYDSTGIIVGKVKSLTTPAQVTPGFYLLDKKPNSVGTIVEIETGEAVASIGQNIFIQSNAGLNVGKRLSVVYTRGMIKDKVRGEIGPMMEVGGEIEITSIVDEKKGHYRAFVLNNVNPIRLNGLVVDEKLPRTNYARIGTRVNTELRILGGEFDESRRLIGESSVVYLDGGSGAGLNVGDILPVQSLRSERRDNSKVGGFRKPIGMIKIFEVQPTVASAVVLEAQDDIRPGDKTGGELPHEMKGISDSDVVEESIDQ